MATQRPDSVEIEAAEPVTVYGTGPIPASILVCGEAWGQYEEKEGLPFVGPSGDELDRYLSSIRISRDQVYVTNVVNERPPNNSDPTPAMIAAHRDRLLEELSMVRPRYVLTLGRFAMRAFLGESASLEREWGIPHTVTIGDRELIVVPAHHPAYGLYSPDDQTLIQEALEGRMGLGWGLRRVLDREIEPHPPVDEYPSPLYAEITDPRDVERLLGAATVCAIDTEGSAANPWCLSVCVQPGEAYVISADRGDVVRAFALWLRDRRPRVVMHYAAHDLVVLADGMGLSVPTDRLADTMLAAYELGPMFPQGLKPLAYRLCGMEMSSYEELTADADRRLAVEYLERVLAERRCETCRGRGVRGWREPKRVIPAHTKQVMTRKGPATRNVKAKVVPAHFESGECEECGGDGVLWPVPKPLPLWDKGQLKVWQPSPIGKRVRRILADVEAGKVNKDGEPTDPRERWEKSDPPDAIEPVTKALGYMPAATLDMVDREAAIAYAARDADATLRVWLTLDPLLDDWELRDTYNTDIAIIPLLVGMQQTGVRVDRDYFAELSREWRGEMARVRHRLQKLVGYYVNPASSKQVANLLFVKLRLPPVKLTKSKLGESTDDKVLEQLRMDTGHAAIPLLQRHRELHKLDGTYAEPLSRVDSADCRVRMEMKYTRTDTGRLSSSKPRRGRDKHNWIQGQNIPTRGEEGKRIRHGFVAEDGCLLGSWDLSQIEWRIMAHLSQDANLLKVFRSGLDLHVMTAALIWKIVLEEVTKEQRTSAKNIGFGMGYKITWRGLQAQFAVRGIKLTREESQAFIDGFMNAYPGIPRLWESIFAEARRNGYVRSQDGRIRWATAARCTASWVREAAEREIGNFPTQGLAAWVLKQVLIATDEQVVKPLAKVGIRVRVWLTVHDSIEMEFPEGAEDLIDSRMRRVMSETIQLSVPVAGDGKWGKRWSECKD